MGIDESGQDNLAGAIDFDNLLAMLLDPGIAQGVFGLAGRNNLSTQAQHSAVLYDAKVAEPGSSPRTGLAGGGAQSKQLADVDQQQRTLG